MATYLCWKCKEEFDMGEVLKEIQELETIATELAESVQGEVTEEYREAKCARDEFENKHYPSYAEVCCTKCGARNLKGIAHAGTGWR